MQSRIYRIQIPLFALFLAGSIWGQTPTFILEQEEGAHGEIIEVDITLENFDRAASFFASFTWDSDVLAFERISYVNENIELKNENISLVENSRINIAWASPDLINGTSFSRRVLARVTFVVIGLSGDESNLSFEQNLNQELEYYKFSQSREFELVDAYYQNGDVSVIKDSYGGPAFHLLNSEVVGDTMIVDLYGANFESATSFLVSIFWDQDLLELVETKSGLVDVGSISQYGTGRLIITWETDNLMNGFSSTSELLASFGFRAKTNESCLPVQIQFGDIFERHQPQEYWRIAGSNFQQVKPLFGGVKLSTNTSNDVFLGMNLEKCPEDAISLSIPNEWKARDVIWYRNDEMVSASLNSIEVVRPGSYRVEFWSEECLVISNTILISNRISSFKGLRDDLEVHKNTPYQVPFLVDGPDYKWTATDSISLSCNDCPQPFLTATGNGTLSLELVDEYGCSSYSSVVVELLERPIEKLTVFTPFANPSCANINDGRINLLVRGGVRPYRIFWEDGNEDIARTELSEGVYRGKVIDSADNNVSFEVTLQSQELPEVAVELTHAICGQENGGISLSFLNPSDIESVFWPLTGEYGLYLDGLGPNNYSFSATDIFGCVIKDTLTVVDDSIRIEVDSDFVLCSDSLFVKASSNFGEIEWYQDDEFLGLGDSLLISRPGTYLLETSYNDCDVSTEFRVFSAATEVSLPSDTIIKAGQDIQYRILGDLSSINWIAPPSYMLECISCLENTISPDSSGIVKLEIVTNEGCLITHQWLIDVRYEAPINPVNFMSPNGDNINDKLVFENLTDYEDRRLIVYNEWGQRLLEIKDYNNGWDGKYNGKYLPDGTYYYVLSYSDQGLLFTTKGDLLLIK